MPRFLIALALLGLMAGPALAGSSITIIYPTQRSAAPVAEKQPVKAIQQNVAVTIVVVPYESRHARTKRALFQNWTGFYKQYSGPRYPF
jgi:hypothetical protein